jgi:type I restriction enzyme M protein
MTQESLKNLKTQLWSVADALRGKMNADEFRDYCLGFIFYKYLSERIENKANKLLIESEETIRFAQLSKDNEEHAELLEALEEEMLDSLGYFLYPHELFAAIAKRGAETDTQQGEFILDDLDNILSNIEQSTLGTQSEHEFENLFEDLQLDSTKLGKTPVARNELICRIMNLLNKIDFCLENDEEDVLGDAYEYLIGEFASGAGKKAGEFYTPQCVSKILARIVTDGKTELKSVYDPTCGSGSLLLRVARQEGIKVHKFFGQEMNRTTYNLARMNMILHDVHYTKFSIENDDTLEHPKHLDNRFEAIVSNPPFSADWSAKQTFETDDRFSQYGKLAPRTKADYAFITHMIHHLDENGTMAIVLPHGALFRGAAEGHIREYLLKERNFLDTVIGLPSNLFFGTSIPSCILVFKKCRPDPKHVLFIDASREFVQGKNQNELNAEQIDNILCTYRDRSTQDKYSYLASMEEIEENDYNLNIPRYVDTFEEEEPVDIQQVLQERKQIEQDLAATKAQMQAFLKELGIE